MGRSRERDEARAGEGLVRDKRKGAPFGKVR